jgi:ABC-type antimicrobial peptide transport system permease subunit
MYYLKMIFRNLRRNGLYSIINISGLAVSLCVCILISLWVKDELSFDRYYKNGNSIYKVLSHNKASSEYWAGTPAPLAALIKPDIALIEEYCRIGFYDRQCDFLDNDNAKFRDYLMLAVDTSFFDMFDVALIRGDNAHPLPTDLAMIISESKAKTFFGNEDPIGKVLKTPFDFSFTVTGIMKDIPQNSSVRPDILVRFDVQQRTFAGNGDWKLIDEDWGSYNYETYFKLSAGSDPVVIAGLMEGKIHHGDNGGFRLQPLSEIYLYDEAGQPAGVRQVWLFSVIAVLILAVACINHVNLVTARATKRSREIAVRKIVGAKKINLFGQLIGETAMMLVIALCFAMALIAMALPYFNNLAGKNMRFDLLSPSTILIFLIAGVITLLLAGLYPAYFLASFRATDAFARNIKGKGKTVLRKVLVVTQFAFSAALIVATIAITTQLWYMQNMNPGYDKENIFTVFLPGLPDQSGSYRNIMERLSSEPSIAGTSASMFHNMESEMIRSDIWRDKDGRSPNFAWVMVDPGFFSLMEIPVVEGTLFRENESVNKRGTILNETAARLIGGGESVIGMNLSFGSGDTEVIGVVKDFNIENLHIEIKPLVINCYTEWQPYLYVKAAKGKNRQAIASVETIWKEYYADYDFTYTFLDESFDVMYKSDLRTGRLFSIFAAIAIIISCLGLFGLVTYTAETKVKEIGIRKVLGASISDVVMMLSKDFLIMVGIAVLIAFPPAYYFLDGMLQDYAYRIELSWWMFAASVLIVTMLTLFTVGFKAIKAALMNPVNAIKSE